MAFGSVDTEKPRTFITDAVLETQEPRMVRLHVSSNEVGFGAVNQKQGWLKIVGSRGAYTTELTRIDNDV
jgi:hypothetical protein